MAEQPAAQASADVVRTPAQEVFELNKLTFRLAKTKDAQMEQILGAVLPTVLECIDPSKPAVQKAAVGVISHVMKRAKSSQKTLKLPCKVLLDAMNKPGASAFTKNFAVMLLDLGLPGLDAAGLQSLFPSIVTGLTRHTVVLQEKLLRMTLQCLPHVNARLCAEQITEQDKKELLSPLFDHVKICLLYTSPSPRDRG